MKRYLMALALLLPEGRFPLVALHFPLQALLLRQGLRHLLPGLPEGLLHVQKGLLNDLLRVLRPAQKVVEVGADEPA